MEYVISSISNTINTRYSINNMFICFLISIFGFINNSEYCKNSVFQNYIVMKESSSSSSMQGQVIEKLFNSSQLEGFKIYDIDDINSINNNYKNLSNFINNITTNSYEGFWGSSIDIDDFYNKNGIIFLRIRNISNYGLLNPQIKMIFEFLDGKYIDDWYSINNNTGNYQYI